MSAVLRNNPLASLSDSGAANDANMLVPQAYEHSWTELAQVFDPQASPGAVLSPQAAAAAQAAVGYNSGASNLSGLVATANPMRACFMLQNNSASGGPVLWFAFGQPAVANAPGSFALQPGGSLVIANKESCPKESLYVAWSGTGTQLASFYQNSLPMPPAPPGTSGGWETNSGAQAWGYSTPPAPAPAPAPTYSGFRAQNIP